MNSAEGIRMKDPNRLNLYMYPKAGSAVYRHRSILGLHYYHNPSECYHFEELLHALFSQVVFGEVRSAELLPNAP